MPTLEEKNSKDWMKSAFLAGFSSAGVALTLPTVPPTGGRQIERSSIGAWEEDSVLENYVENLNRLPRSILSYGSGSTYQLRKVIVKVQKMSIGDMPEKLQLKTPSSLVADIRSMLSLQVKELAEAVGVERPTVYAWIKGLSEPQRNNSVRLRQLHRLAQAWGRLSKNPLGAAIREPNDAGQSILDHLKEEPIPEETIRNRFRAIASQVRQTAVSRRPGIREFASEHGIDLSNVQERTDVFDITTGKRDSLE